MKMPKLVLKESDKKPLATMRSFAIIIIGYLCWQEMSALGVLFVIMYTSLVFARKNQLTADELELYRLEGIRRRTESLPYS